MKSALNFILFSILFSLWTSCAIQVPPAGGDKDVAPPKITKSVPENNSTGFVGHEFSITFDEYVQLKDVQSQLLVSPPLKNFPEVKIRKKTLHVSFEDTLEANTTYSFNFANSIVDNNEGNLLENFQYVFSTGNVIDSLEISGIVKNAFDRKPARDVLVMLYKDNIDSLPYKKRPYYFAKTDAEGTFRIRYLRPGYYKLTALKDINKDYLFNPEDESIAFTDSLIAAGASDISLDLFKEEEKFKLLRSYSEEPGKAVIIFNGAADTIPHKWISDTAALGLYAVNYSEKKDTMEVWYKNQLADTIQLSFPSMKGLDTLTIRLLKKDSRNNFRVKQNLRIVAQTSAGLNQDLNSPFELTFSHPVSSYDSGRIEFTEDSVPLPSASFEWRDSLHTRLRFTKAWTPKAIYNLMIPSGAFKDIFGLENDTLLFGFRTRQETDYASLSTNITYPAGHYPLLVQLVDENEKVFREFSAVKDTSMVFEFLLPGTYRLKVIQDTNRNGRWDSGVYLEKKHPEKIIYYPEPIQIRSNWDVEIKWLIP